MPKMRAMIVPQGGAKLRLEEREVPEPRRPRYVSGFRPVACATAMRRPCRGT